MFCSECGEQVADNNNFCGECGAIVNGLEPEKATEAESKNNLQSSLTFLPSTGNNNIANYIFGGVVIFVIIFVAIAILFSTSVPQTIKIGDLLHSGSFDIRIKNVSVSETLRTGNEFADPKPQQGTQFLVIDGDYKNIDSETHTLSSGYVAVDMDEKKLIYDKAELILNDGWGLIFEKVGPAITKSTKLVYRIPLNIKGKVYFYPINNRNDVIEIGFIENGTLKQENSAAYTGIYEYKTNEVSVESTDGNFEKIDSMVLTLKYSSNPFEVRKLLGKKMETEIFAKEFIDEGSTAMVIDANVGFYCRMSGAEYGQHNKIGTMIVRGILAESNGRLGLDNCNFVSNDASAIYPSVTSAGE
jgi:hypothetical protein